MTRRTLRTLFAVALLALACVGLWRAAQPLPVQSAEATVDAIADTLRCPTCQGLSVAASPSPLAEGMREIIAEQLAEGRTPDQIREWFVQRYGAWILLTPPTSAGGWAVWSLPAVLVVVGAVAAVRWSRRRDAIPPATPEDRVAALEALADFQNDRIAAEDTAGGERLVAALEMLASVAADREDGQATAEAYDAAVDRVAVAIRAVAEERRLHQRSEGTPPRRPLVPVPARWAAIGVVFSAVTLALLLLNTAARQPGQVLTGAPAADAAATGSSEAPPVEAVVDVEDELLRIAQLLQNGEVDEALRRAQALAEAAPDSLDALLLLGVAQTQAGDPAGPTTLRRFLELAPADHAGVQLARRWLDDGR